MRENIDPTGAYEDVDIWTALDQVRVKLNVDLDTRLSASLTMFHVRFISRATSKALIMGSTLLSRKEDILYLKDSASLYASRGHYYVEYVAFENIY